MWSKKAGRNNLAENKTLLVQLCNSHIYKRYAPMKFNFQAFVWVSDNDIPTWLSFNKKLWVPSHLQPTTLVSYRKHFLHKKTRNTTELQRRCNTIRIFFPTTATLFSPFSNIHNEGDDITNWCKHLCSSCLDLNHLINTSVKYPTA